MTRLPVRKRAGIAGSVVALLALASCSVAAPADRPLPTVDELEALFGEQASGTGRVRDVDVDGKGRDYPVAVEYVRQNVFYFRMSNDGPDISATIIAGFNPDSTLRDGTEFGISVFYAPESGANRSGSGRMTVTAIEGDLIAGVFAADVGAAGGSGETGQFFGAFNATRDPVP